ncbi:hypothetical protein NDU88_006161 [Pleurodeles waltl]|uniref:Uncharacterized protein n=1 Tax=Pleurodeles waltl TaxID=8319 RepID=A0AAV7W9U1_PLEWA|nr:hypothetical protein NDU88_006161 [Pleurodeles waltl]
MRLLRGSCLAHTDPKAIHCSIACWDPHYRLFAALKRGEQRCPLACIGGALQPVQSSDAEAAAVTRRGPGGAGVALWRWYRGRRWMVVDEPL